MCVIGSTVSVAIVLIIFGLIPSHPGLFLEFEFLISFSNSDLVIGLKKKLFSQLLARYLSKVVLLLGSFFC